jgi:serine protease Do
MEARIVGVSNELDLALLKIDAKGLPALPIGRYDKLQQGELVFAFGSPGGLRNSVTMGVVSAVARQLNPDSPLVYIQTDAPINPGNSGGPLVDADGELVGINTLILSQSGGSEGLGFAIPSAIVNFAFPQLRQYGHLHRGHIGINVQTVTPSLAAGLGLSKDWGVIVSDVLPGGPADVAGLKIQDIFLTLNGKTIDSVPVFALRLFTCKAGEHMKIEVLRGTEKLLFEVLVVEQEHNVDRLLDMADPEKNLIVKLGVLGVDVDSTVKQVISDLRQPSGVIVVARASGSREAETSLAVGDVIHALNGTIVIGIEFLRLALDRLKPDSPVVLQIERDGRLMYLTLQVD